MGLVVWSPLAGGALTGKYDDGVPEGSRADRTETLDEYLTDETRPRIRRSNALPASSTAPPRSSPSRGVCGARGARA